MTTTPSVIATITKKPAVACVCLTVRRRVEGEICPSPSEKGLFPQIGGTCSVEDALLVRRSQMAPSPDLWQRSCGLNLWRENGIAVAAYVRLRTDLRLTFG